jgi:hypothetical protein
LFRGGMAWQESKREKTAKLRAELDAPKVGRGLCTSCEFSRPIRL